MSDTELVVVEIDDEDPGFVRAGAGEVAARAHMSLNQALEVIRPTANAIIEKIQALPIKPSEIEVEMGVKLNARIGAVLASATSEGHIRVKLAWKQEPFQPAGPGS